jgi:hypothetical protein
LGIELRQAGAHASIETIWQAGRTFDPRCQWTFRETHPGAALVDAGAGERTSPVTAELSRRTEPARAGTLPLKSIAPFHMRVINRACARTIAMRSAI